MIRTFPKIIEFFTFKLEWNTQIRILSGALKVSQNVTVTILKFEECCFNMHLHVPCHEIMVLFILHKPIFQMHMRSHPVGLDVWFLVWPFDYFHTSCVQTAKALARLHECAGSPEPSLVAFVISTIISWAGSVMFIRCRQNGKQCKP